MLPYLKDCRNGWSRRIPIFFVCKRQNCNRTSIRERCSKHWAISPICIRHKKKGYSGVALLTKQEPDHVEYGMGMEAYDNEGRFIRADFGDLSVVSVYHPSGTSGDERQAFKMVWLEDFQKYVLELQKSRPNLILCGDYNICHEPIDIHDPVRNAKNSGFLPEEREWMTRFLAADSLILSVCFIRKNRSIPGGVTVLTRVPRIRVGESTIAWPVNRSARY